MLARSKGREGGRDRSGGRRFFRRVNGEERGSKKPARALDRRRCDAHATLFEQRPACAAAVTSRGSFDGTRPGIERRVALNKRRERGPTASLVATRRKTGATPTREEERERRRLGEEGRERLRDPVRLIPAERRGGSSSGRRRRSAKRRHPARGDAAGLDRDRRAEASRVNSPRCPGEGDDRCARERSTDGASERNRAAKRELGRETLHDLRCARAPRSARHAGLELGRDRGRRRGSGNGRARDVRRSHADAECEERA